MVFFLQWFSFDVLLWWFFYDIFFYGVFLALNQCIKLPCFRSQHFGKVNY